jgi:hypothetical protein
VSVRLGLESPSGGGGVLVIRGVIEGVEIEVRWSEISFAKTALEITAMYSDEREIDLEPIKKLLPWMVSVERDGASVRIDNHRNAVLFPTRTITRWVETLVASRR